MKSQKGFVYRHQTVVPLALVLVGFVSQACTQGQITTQPSSEALTQSSSSSSSSSSSGGTTSSSSSSSGGYTSSSSSSSSSSSGTVSQSGIENVTWTSPCIEGSVEPVNPASPANFCNLASNYYNPDDCQAFNIIVTETYTNNGNADQGTFMLTETRYADTVCATEIEEQVYMGDYTLSQSTADAGAWNVNYTSQQTTITLWDNDPSGGDPAADYNDIDACGSSSWSDGNPASVVGTSCSSMATLYTTAEVVDGNLNVSNFSPTDTGQSPGTRPTDLSTPGNYVVYTVY